MTTVNPQFHIESPNETPVDRPIYAAGLLICSMLLMSFIDNLVRAVSDDITVWQFHFLRAAFALPIIAILAVFMPGQTLRQRCPFWVCLRAAVIAISMLFFFASIPMMQMAQATAGLFTAPLFVLVYSAIFLGESIGPRRIGAVVFGFAGVLLILQPFRDDIDWLSALPVAAGAFYAVGVVLTRLRCRDESPLALIFANFCAFAILGAGGIWLISVFPPSAEQQSTAPFVFSAWRTPSISVVMIMAGLAAGAVLGIGGLTRAYQLADTSFLTLFDYAHVIGACFFAYLLWSEVPPNGSIVGVAMIVASGVFLAWRNHARTSTPRIARSGEI